MPNTNESKFRLSHVNVDLAEMIRAKALHMVERGLSASRSEGQDPCVDIGEVFDNYQMFVFMEKAYEDNWVGRFTPNGARVYFLPAWYTSSFPPVDATGLIIRMPDRSEMEKIYPDLIDSTLEDFTKMVYYEIKLWQGTTGIPNITMKEIFKPSDLLGIVGSFEMSVTF